MDYQVGSISFSPNFSYSSTFASTISSGNNGSYGNVEKHSYAKTSGGQFYGGDGSGSFSDYFSRFVYEVDQWNPIALAWDGIKGQITGTDRYGNTLTPTESNWKIAAAIPVGKYMSVTESVWNHIFRDAVGHVNPGTLSSQMRYYKLFQGVAKNPLNLVPTKNAAARAAGVLTYNQTFRNGSTVWVQTINGVIRNAGVNLP